MKKFPDFHVFPNAWPPCAMNTGAIPHYEDIAKKMDLLQFQFL